MLSTQSVIHWRCTESPCLSRTCRMNVQSVRRTRTPSGLCGTTSAGLALQWCSRSPSGCVATHSSVPDLSQRCPSHPIPTTGRFRSARGRVLSGTGKRIYEVFQVVSYFCSIQHNLSSCVSLYAMRHKLFNAVLVISRSDGLITFSETDIVINPSCCWCYRTMSLIYSRHYYAFGRHLPPEGFVETWCAC